MALSVSADEIQMGYSKSKNGYYGPYNKNGDGEFTVVPVDPSGWLPLYGYESGVTINVGPDQGSFQTFCVEGKEVIGPYPNTYDAVINTKAINGGLPPSAGGDPISVGTAYLYSQFAAGTLGGYNYSGTTAQRTASAVELQNAFWWLESENNLNYDPTNPFELEVVTEFGSPAAAMADGTGWNYGVRVLNLTTTDPQHKLRQDLLVKVPDGGMTMALLGIAMGCIGAMSRRLRK